MRPTAGSLHIRSPGLLLEHLGITDAEDIDMEAIAQACGATIIYQPLSGCSARLVGLGSRAIITVDSRNSRARQRFSAAHELGHWMHDRGKVAFACNEGQFVHEWGEANIERRANRFAANLLLPRAIFKRRIRNEAVNFDLVKILSHQFMTSLTATAIRLIEFTAFPAILACYEGGQRSWVVRSPSTPAELALKARMPHWSAASEHRIGLPAKPDAQPDGFPAELWFDHPDAIFYTVYAEACRVSAEAELVLLTWRDETQLLQATQFHDADPHLLSAGDLESEFALRRSPWSDA
jgi:hypothetical protein